MIEVNSSTDARNVTILICNSFKDIWTFYVKKNSMFFGHHWWTLHAHILAMRASQTCAWLCLAEFTYQTIITDNDYFFCSSILWIQSFKKQCTVSSLYCYSSIFYLWVILWFLAKSWRFGFYQRILWLKNIYVGS